MPAKTLSEWASAVHYLQSILSNIDVGILLVEGSERKIVFANLAFGKMLGVSTADLIGKKQEHAVELLASLSAESDRTTLTMAIPDTGAYEGHGDLVLNYPTRRVVRWSVRPVPIPTGIGQLYIFDDITAVVTLAEQHRAEARTDALTGLLNRRGGDEIIRREMSRVDRASIPLCVAFFDVDGFKQVNDRHGHHIGDLVLKNVASTIASNLRPSDAAIRWGGDEFLVLLPHSSVEGAIAFSERVCKAVAVESNGLPVTTVSAGITSVLDGDSFERALERADEQLRSAKPTSHRPL